MIRITADEAWWDAHDAIVRFGHVCESREGTTREVNAHVIGVETFRMRNFIISRPSLMPSPHYACAEALWYLLADSDTAFLVPYAPSYAKNWAEPNGRAHGTNYGDRANKWEGLLSTSDFTSSADFNRVKNLRNRQLDLALQVMREHPNTRRCILQLWRPSDLAHTLLQSTKTVPCNTQLQFIIRCGRLDMHVYVRSQDIWYGLTYDIFTLSMLQMVIAHALGVDPGTHHRYIASMHAYERDWNKLTTGVEDTRSQWKKPLDSGFDDVKYKSPTVEAFDAVSTVGRIEKTAQTNPNEAADLIWQNTVAIGTCLTDIAVGVVHFWCLKNDLARTAEQLEQHVTDRGLRGALQIKRERMMNKNELIREDGPR